MILINVLHPMVKRDIFSCLTKSSRETTTFIFKNKDSSCPYYSCALFPFICIELSVPCLTHYSCHVPYNSSCVFLLFTFMFQTLPSCLHTSLPPYTYLHLSHFFPSWQHVPYPDSLSDTMLLISTLHATMLQKMHLTLALNSKSCLPS